MIIREYTFRFWRHEYTVTFWADKFDIKRRRYRAVNTSCNFIRNP